MLDFFRWSVPLLALFLCNCATLKTQPRYSGFGEADLSRDRAVVDRFKAMRATPAPEVKVLVDTLPEGLTLKDGVLQVESGYAHELLGKFQLIPQSSFYSLFWFADYDDEWRKGLCYPQVPLMWLTGSIWAVVPTFYPCFGKNTQDRMVVLDDVKRVTQAAEGDLASIHFGEFASQEPEETFGAQGYILRVDPRVGTGNTRTLPKAPSRQL